MEGIVAYGGYIPRLRIDRGVIYKAVGWLNPATFMKGEKAVGNFDEDSLTMAVAAGMECLKGLDRKTIDALYFASTTPPYAERQNAEIAATALDLKSRIRTADFTGTLKAGTTALLSAVDSVKAGSMQAALICSADQRTGKPGSAQEEIFGDGAAALLIGSDDVAAQFIGSFSVSYDFADHWRSAGSIFDRQWEDRFIRDAGYVKFVVEVLEGLAKETGITADQISKVIYPCLYTADFKKIARTQKLSEQQIVEPLGGQIGFTGTPDPFIHLVKALDEARPGDRIAVVAFGAGAEAVLFEVTENIDKLKGARRGIGYYIENKRQLNNYEKMVSFRNLLPMEKGIRGEVVPPTAISALWRIRDQILGLYGTRCEACGTPQFPAQRVCVKPDCGAVNQMVPYRFSDKKGKLFTFTSDYLAYSVNPPSIYGVVDFEGGGRYQFDLTDVDIEDVKVDMPLEMSFRRKYLDEDAGIHSYFWKAIPAMP